MFRRLGVHQHQARRFFLLAGFLVFGNVHGLHFEPHIAPVFAEKYVGEFHARDIGDLKLRVVSGNLLIQPGLGIGVAYGIDQIGLRNRFLLDKLFVAGTDGSFVDGLLKSDFSEKPIGHLYVI